jgi:hypothetical protein
MKKRMIGCGLRAIRRRWLVYDKASPMREPLACLFTFATAVCEEAREASPPWAIRFSLRLQTAAANSDRPASDRHSADAH